MQRLRAANFGLNQIEVNQDKDRYETQVFDEPDNRNSFLSSGCSELRYIRPVVQFNARASSDYEGEDAFGPVLKAIPMKSALGHKTTRKLCAN